MQIPRIKDPVKREAWQNTVEPALDRCLRGLGKLFQVLGEFFQALGQPRQ